jgi:regulatory protein
MPSGATSEPPDAARLYQAAVHYLARYAATEAGLRRILTQRIDRWARGQSDWEVVQPVIEAARASVDGVIERLMKAGAVSDTAFAESRAKGLVRSGLSNRAIQARLVAKGVPRDVARTASSTDVESELAAALVLVRKRRIGNYRVAGEADDAIRIKEMGVMARAGFSRDIARQALETPREDAENRIFELRR